MTSAISPPRSALAGLLAEHPTDRVEDVGFAATIGPDHGSHATVEFHLGFRGKRLEAEEFERLEIHAIVLGLEETKETGFPGVVDRRMANAVMGRKCYWRGRLNFRPQDIVVQR